MVDFNKKNFDSNGNNDLMDKYNKAKNNYACACFRLQTVWPERNMNINAEEEFDNTINAVINCLEECFSSEILKKNQIESLCSDEYIKNEFVSKLKNIPNINYFLGNYNVNGRVSISYRDNIYVELENNIVKNSCGLYLLTRERSDHFCKDNFEHIFIGEDIEWVCEFIKLIKPFRKSSELDDKMFDYRERKRIQNDFLNSVIFKLLMDESKKKKENINRAMIFDSYFGIGFNFEPYKTKKLYLKLIKR